MIQIHSIGYIVLVLLLSLVYIYISKVIFLYIKDVIKGIKDFRLGIFIPKKEIFNIYPKSKIFKILLCIFILTHLFFVQKRREEFFTDKTRYSNAKQYLLPITVIYIYKAFLVRVIGIRYDNIIIKPFHILQDHIYKKAMRYIPKDDGERALWRYRFYDYFGSVIDLPQCLEIGPRDICPEAVKIVDHRYKLFLDMTTNEYADKNMEKYKYKVSQLLASKYLTEQTYYFGTEPGGYRTLALLNSQKHMRRVKTIVQKLLDLEEVWMRYKDVVEFNFNKNPASAVHQYESLIYALALILFQKLQRRTFRCDDRYLAIYLHKRQQMLKSGSVLYKLSKKDQDLAWTMAFDGVPEYLTIYIAHHLCKAPKDTAYPTAKWIENRQKDINTLLGELRNVK